MQSRKPASALIIAVSMVLSIAVSACSSNDSSSSSPGTLFQVPPLRASDTNLIFVVTPDLANNSGDIDPKTANLNNRGLQRALKQATYLHTTLLNSANVTGIYALEPCTHPQTANNYPDMVPLEIIEQFALVNQYSENVAIPPAPAQNVVNSSFPINTSYTAKSLPAGAGVPPAYFPACQGIDFADKGGGNEELINGIVAKKQGGYYVFALPFVTFQSLLTNLKTQNSYGYAVPTSWEGPNMIYVLKVPTVPGDSPVLASYDTHVTPGDTYPNLTPTYAYSPTNFQNLTVINTSTTVGSSIPANISTNQTVYLVRHAEAHPSQLYDDGNLIMAGDWRALYLPTALAGRITNPDFVYAVDPAQAILGMPASTNPNGQIYSYVRTSQTVAPYAIANGIPLCVASNFQWSGTSIATDKAVVTAFVDYFFTGGRFSNKTLLIGWEHDHIPEIGKNLVDRYFANATNAPALPNWPGADYDTVWAFTLDSGGNLTFSNAISQGINTTTLPDTPPSF